MNNSGIVDSIWTILVQITDFIISLIKIFIPENFDDLKEPDKIALTAFSAFAIWLATSSIGYILTRKRIRVGLLQEINFYINLMKDARPQIEDFKTMYCATEPSPLLVDSFYPSEDSFYKTQLPVLPKYFRTKTINKIYNFYQKTWVLEKQLQDLMEHIKSLMNAKRLNEILEQSRLEKKFDNILKLVDYLTKKEIKYLYHLKSPDNEVPSSIFGHLKTVMKKVKKVKEKI